MSDNYSEDIDNRIEDFEEEESLNELESNPSNNIIFRLRFLR